MLKEQRNQKICTLKSLKISRCQQINSTSWFYIFQANYFQAPPGCEFEHDNQYSSYYLHYFRKELVLQLTIYFTLVLQHETKEKCSIYGAPSSTRLEYQQLHILFLHSHIEEFGTCIKGIMSGQPKALHTSLQVPFHLLYSAWFWLIHH